MGEFGPYPVPVLSLEPFIKKAQIVKNFKVEPTGLDILLVCTSWTFEHQLCTLLAGSWLAAPLISFSIFFSNRWQFCCYWLYLKRTGHLEEWSLTRFWLCFFFLQTEENFCGFEFYFASHLRAVWWGWVRCSLQVQPGGWGLLPPSHSGLWGPPPHTDGHRCSGQRAVTCAISQRRKASQNQFLMKVSPSGCSHQRCQPAAVRAMKATGCPVGMYTAGDWSFHCALCFCFYQADPWCFKIFLEVLHVSGTFKSFWREWLSLFWMTYSCSWFCIAPPS